jgi:hypothetical protein
LIVARTLRKAKNRSTETRHHELDLDLAEKEIRQSGFEIITQQERFIDHPGDEPWGLTFAQKTVTSGRKGLSPTGVSLRSRKSHVAIETHRKTPKELLGEIQGKQSQRKERIPQGHLRLYAWRRQIVSHA